jgi:hypothetical protein
MVYHIPQHTPTVHSYQFGRKSLYVYMSQSYPIISYNDIINSFNHIIQYMSQSIYPNVISVSAVYPIGSMVLLYMVCHGSHQYTPFMLAYIPAPWIRHGYYIPILSIYSRCFHMPPLLRRQDSPRLRLIGTTIGHLQPGKA